MIRSFLLIGQSNMAGRGFLPEAVPVDFSRVRVLRNGLWTPAFRPVNPDRGFSGVNLAESFAEAYAKKYDVDVGLIPCADGGTCLHQWQIGSLLYDHAIAQARLAQRTSTIAGVLWHQGESDCHDDRYPTYAERFQPILDGFRRDLDLNDVPFLLGGMGEFLANCERYPEVVNYRHINNALRRVAAANDRVGFVSAEGLTANPDNLHFNAASLYEFGLRYFAEFEKLRDPNKIFVEKPSQDDAVRSSMETL
jgi:hypothetical protein